MDVIPNDVRLIVWKYIHCELLKDVNDEYSDIQVDWDGDCFFRFIGGPYLMYRTFSETKGWVHFMDYTKCNSVFNFRIQSIKSVHKLPENY